MRLEHAIGIVEDVRYANGPLTLAAELRLPQGQGPFPGAVIVQGSGASDRTNAWSREFAAALIDSGLAVLLTDKRGTGQSQGDWRKASFDELAADAAAGVYFLRSRSDIRSVGLVGLSQGGRVAPLAASRVKDLAFIVSVSGSAVSGEEQLLHEITNDFKGAGHSHTEIEALLEAVRAGLAFARTGAGWSDYAALRSKLATAARLQKTVSTFPSDPGDERWAIWRATLDFDPLPAWANSSVPALVVLGEEDERENVPVARSVERLRLVTDAARSRLTVKVFAGTGHSLRGTNGALRADVLSFITEWLRKQLPEALESSTRQERELARTKPVPQQPRRARNERILEWAGLVPFH